MKLQDQGITLPSGQISITNPAESSAGATAFPSNKATDAPMSVAAAARYSGHKLATIRSAVKSVSLKSIIDEGITLILKPDLVKFLAENNGMSAKAGGQKNGLVLQHITPLDPAIMAPHTPANPLSEAEAQLLAHHESTIRSFLNAWLPACKALAEINAKRLYRQKYDTFEDYTFDQWGFGHSKAYRLMECARVTAILSPIGESYGVRVPDCEAQMRPLTSLPEEKVIPAWTEVLKRAGSKPVTAELVSQVAKEFRQSSQAGSQEPVTESDERDVTPPSKLEEAIAGILSATSILVAAAESGLTRKEKTELKKIGALVAKSFAVITA